MVRSPDEKPPRPPKLLSTLEDERRLFPSNSRLNDPNGVRIIPGQIMPKRKKIGESPFKVVDRISGKARQSGPVRASKKETRPHDPFIQERPAKRSRHRAPEPSNGKLLSLVDKDADAQSALTTSPTATHASRMSPTSSQRSGKTKRKRNNLFPLEEFCDIESYIKPPLQHKKGPKHGKKQSVPTMPDDDHEERFTRNTAKDRRRRASSEDDGNSWKTGGADRPSKPQVLQGVEITSSKDHHVGNHAVVISPRRNNMTSPTMTRGHSESPESPDELQVTDQKRRSKEMMKKGENEKPFSPVREQRRSSPADIQPTVFTPSKTKRGLKAKKQKATANPVALSPSSFGVVYARFGLIEQQAPHGKEVELVLDSVRGGILLRNKTDPAGCFDLPLHKVTKAIEGAPPSCKVRLVLSKMEGSDQKIDLELSSVEEREQFCNGLKRQNIDPVQRPVDWMERAFRTHDRELKHHPNGLKRPSAVSPEKGAEKKPASSPVKRMRLADSLRDEKGNPTVTAPRESARPSNSAAKSSPSSPDVSPRASKLSSGLSVQIPVKLYTPHSYPVSDRQTRAMLRRRPSTTILSDDDEEDLSTQSQSDGPVKKWHKPLVYPRFGKKKAEVNMHDRDRLRRNDEFLNDNLIEFYIRFLQEHLNRTREEVSKRVYFFNSFFFDTLVNVPRGKKGINYDGVQKWTRNVDIFSHDYVVVPINEHAHWYLAIICNLPNLQDLAESQVVDEPLASMVQSSALLDSQVQEILETPPPEVRRVSEGPLTSSGAEPAQEEQTRHSLASMSLADEPPEDASKVGTPADEWPEREEIPSNPAQIFPQARVELSSSQGMASQDPARPTESAKSPRKQSTKRTSKIDVTQPTIVTFDSLGIARSPTSRILREYLYEEAKFKKGVEIDAKSIRGMTAQKIPLQPNFSDCGLYLLAYLEKFVQDPDMFIRKILQKEDVEWPPLKSGHLRKRLRKFLDALYDEQEQLSRQETSAKETMADRQPICYLLGSPISSPAAHREEKAVESPKKAPRDQHLKSPFKAPESQPSQPDPHSPSKAPEIQPPPKGGIEASELKDEADACAKENEDRDEIDEVRLVASTHDEKEPSSSHTGPGEMACRSHPPEEVIEVPDSQEPTASSLMVKPESARPDTPISSPSEVKSEANKPYTPLHLSVLALDAESKAHKKGSGDVADLPETQVPGTPSKPSMVKDSPTKHR
ncbi:SUMO protease ULP2 [Aspergillus saccharolyticus JOP 1030-1]|uniref:Cysteine proteinase n=1 Tax=Aspergillus saccharolyticus JOP 1030-1 TaxID=1450539 RepID=A0A318Z8F9_9EURO|nr:cysteine proteinase [Aspergillus saccharolyticus JOP 1030-1]PYH42684.1 cysteine proteinase [Aspergillus saccharolyticus JOP 1030-1]